MGKTSVKITPYKCRVLYLEYKDIVSKRKSLTEFIIKADLTDLHRRLQTTKISFHEVVHLSLSIFLKVADLHENTHDFFRNYLEGVGSVPSCDEGARMSGSPISQDEIIRLGLAKSYVLTYIYYSVLCNKVAKDNVDIGGILSELLEEKNKITHISLEDALGKLNQKVKEVDDLISQLRNINMEFDITDSLKVIDSIKNKIEIVGKGQQGNLDNINQKMAKLNESIYSTGEQFSKLTQNTETVINRFGLILDQLGNKLDTEALKAESALAKQKQMAFNVMNDANRVDDITKRLDNTLSELEELFIDNRSTTDLLDTLRKVQSFITDLQNSTRGQAIMTKEIDEKVQTIEEGVSVIKKVLDSLNAIMREDILISLARTGKGVQGTASGVEAVGNKYKQIRNGGIINELNTQ